MYKLAIGIAFGLLFSNAAMATCSSYPYTLTNGTTADATQVTANFNCAALTSGATINAATLSGGTTLSGTTTFPGATVIDSSGRVSVGYGSPTALIEAVSSSNATGFDLVPQNIAVVHNVSTNPVGDQVTPGGFQIVRDKSSAVANGDTLGALSWNARYDSEDRAGYASVAAIARSSGTAALTFNVSSTALTTIEAVRIDYNGSVGIGTSSPSYTLHVNGSVAGTSAYVNLSDARLKKNVVPLVGGLALVSKLQPVRFDWRSESERKVGKEFILSAGKQIGFIAQDLSKVLPEAVSTAKGKDAIMSVAESKIVPVLVTAVKELKASNDNQAAEIAQLEGRVAALQRKLDVQTAIK